MFSSNNLYSSKNSLGAIVGANTVLIIILTIAVIVLTVVLYRKFIGKKSDGTKPLARLLNFDHLYIENITKGLYILSVLGITAFCVYLPLSALTTIGSVGASAFGAFLIALVVAALLFVLLQVACRLGFEMTMMAIRAVVDIRAIRNEVAGPAAGKKDALGDAPGFSLFGKRKGEEKKAAVVGSSSVVDAAPVSAVPQGDVAETWDCVCGKTGNTGKFCSKCGSPRP